MKVGWAWREIKTIEETVLATELGSGGTAKQEGTEPREFGNLNMYQAWLSTRVWGMGVRGTRSPIVIILGKGALTQAGPQEEQDLAIKTPLTTLGGLECLAELGMVLPFNSLLNAKHYARHMLVLFFIIIKQEHIPKNGANSGNEPSIEETLAGLPRGPGQPSGD